jgi:signal transduction histidine kinase/ActR/RegA family two-component response regulator
MRELQLRSMIAVPLQVPGETLGVLTFCYSGSSGRRYCREDLWVAEDLARRAAMVVENARLYHELQAASRRKDEFLAMLGHELRNPLAPIRNAARIISLKSPELHGLTEMIERQIQQLARLVDDLIDVSRVGHGKINLEMKPVDLKVVVALAIEMSRPLIDKREHVLEISLPRRAVEVAGDTGRLAQVVSNLLNNSAKYSDDGSRIELTVEANGDQAILSDTGIGIEPAMLPRIFDLFTQVKDSTSRSEEGLGIGLALVRNMIELHGGCVQAESAGLGHGSEFVVRLPLLSRMPAGHPAAAARHKSAWTAPRRRILLIDDNKDATDSMALLLQLAGHEVRTAYDGWTALALARLHPPDVVICDINMPGMSGLDLARQTRQELGLGDCLLVALSGHGQEEDRHQAQEAGFNAFLAKPVRLDLLKALLASRDFLAAGTHEVCQTPILAP